MGSAPAPNSYDPQGDYSALESFFSHMIFYDDYYFIDDYKEQFRESRRADFNFIHPIPQRCVPYEELEKLSIDRTKQFILDIRGGRQAEGLLKDFLEAMELHVTCAWHMQSSDFFLTLKLLADEPDTWDERYKYSPLTAMIFQQLSGTAANFDSPNMVASDGQSIPEREKQGDRVYAMGPEIRHFSNSLNWLARRTVFYSILSAHFDSAMALHPIRHNFFARWTLNDSITESSTVWRHQLSDFFGKKSLEAINTINASTEAIEIGTLLPMFAAWAVGTRGNVRDAVSFIVEVAQKPEAIAVRQLLREIDDLRKSGDILKHKRAVNSLRAAIEAEATKITDRHSGSKLRTIPSVSISAQLLPHPSLSAGTRFDLPDFKLKFGRARYVRTLLRNVVTDVLNFDDLGEVRAALLRQVKRSKDFSLPALRLEERRYFGRSSGWKEPM